MPVTPSQLSSVNALRMSAAIDRLALQVLGSRQNNGTAEFFHLCLSLAKSIDYSVANNEVPERAKALPSLLKRVCQINNDGLLQAAFMVLMVSVKNACNSGWFSEEDCEALLALTKEIGSGFCSVADFNTEASSSLPVISTIMSRFYPRMRMGEILAFLEVKSGYGAYVIDFHISKSTKSSQEEKILLFVAQTNDIETSLCITNPPKVNLLINGGVVPKRNTVQMDPGPQMPTVVTEMLKYGSNLLQAVGEFNGNYIIAVAYMSVMSAVIPPSLPDYVQPTIADLDSDLIEGPSRISLNCPISFRRIKTPVKGHSCKHLQCFDFDNYVDINSRRPSWRCPTCNQHVCFLDICIDQNILKVLKEVANDISDIIISADGSWKAITETEDHINHVQDKSLNHNQNGDLEQNNNADVSQAILDLTEADDGMDAAGICEIEERKPFSALITTQSEIQHPIVDPHVSHGNNPNQNILTHIDDECWSGIFLSTYGVGISGARSNEHTSSGTFQLAANNFLVSPVLTDAVSPVLNKETEPFPGNSLGASLSETRVPASSDLQVQPVQLGNSAKTNEYGISPSVARHVTRTPIAVQALPAQIRATSLQRARNSSNTLIHNLPSVSARITSAVDAFISAHNSMERQPQFIHNQLRESHMTATRQYTGMQVGIQNRSPSSNYSFFSALPSANQNSTQQQALNQRVSHGTNQSSSRIVPSANLPRPLLQGDIHGGDAQRAGLISPWHPQMMVSDQRTAQRPMQMGSIAAQRPMQMGSTAAQRPMQTGSIAAQTPMQMGSIAAQRPMQMGSTAAHRPRLLSLPHLNADMAEQFGGQQSVQKTVEAVQAVNRVDNVGDVPVKQNWRPTGRMRGSLSGEAYSAALNQYIIRPSQAVQPARPPNNIAGFPSAVPSQLHTLMPNINSESQAISLSSTESVNVPHHSPGMR